MHSHDHSHAHDSEEEEIRPILTFSLVLNLLFTAAGIVTALVFGSYALRGDAVHNFSHAVAIGLSIVGLSLVKRHKNLIAIGNLILLISVASWLIYGGVNHLFAPPQEILGLPLVVIASLDIGGDAIVTLLMWKHKKNPVALSLLVHFFFDSLVSLSVIVSGLFIMFWGWYYADAYAVIFIGVAAIISSLFVIRKTYGRS